MRNGEVVRGSDNEMDGLGHVESLLGSVKGPFEFNFQKNWIYPFGVLAGKDKMGEKKVKRSESIVTVTFLLVYHGS